MHCMLRHLQAQRQLSWCRTRSTLNRLFVASATFIYTLKYSAFTNTFKQHLTGIELEMIYSIKNIIYVYVYIYIYIFPVNDHDNQIRYKTFFCLLDLSERNPPVTGSFCTQMGNNVEFWWFLLSHPELTVERTVGLELPVIWNAKSGL